MTLTRNLRNDRRRRVLLESVSQDPELVVENARARRKLREKRKENDYDDYDSSLYRDPGYSQAVRRTCQQRLVQLIPVRRGAIAALICAFWGIFCSLILCHLFLFSSSAVNAPSYVATLPIGQLFHLRSPHGIAHWLSCQLWLLTALVCWMIFNLRRHKLDDYRARYRIWVVVAAAALFSSFDSSTSILQLIGMSIDGWTRKEIGYGGWPLVLASFASLIGILGIRISAELKTVPSSVASWIIGLLAWAAAALLGTGILRVEIEPQYLDLLVGSLWLGGILAVFQAVSLYLRTTYIQAQKRFLQRNGCELGPIQWGMPKVNLPFKRRERDEDGDYSSDTNEGDSELEDGSSRGRRWRMPWSKRERLDESLLDEEPSAETPRSKRRKASESDDEQQSAPKSQTKSAVNKSSNADERKKIVDESELDDELSGNASTKQPKSSKLFGWIPNRQHRNETLEEEPVAEDDGGEIDEGLTKTQGWFGIGGNKKKADSNSDDAAPKKRRLWSKKERAESDELTDEESAPRKKFAMPKWPSKSKKNVNASELDSGSNDDLEQTDSSVAKPKKKWGVPIPKLRKTKNTQESESADKQDVAETNTKKPKGALFGLRKSKASLEPEDEPSAKKVAGKPSKQASNDAANSDEPKPKKKWFGFMDDLKLKPPAPDAVEDAVAAKPAKAEERKPVTPPPPAVAERSQPVATPVPVKQSEPIPSTVSYDDDEDDEDGDYGSRPLSKADRKRLKRESRRS